MGYRPKYYTIKELAHPQIIRTIGEENTWRRIDEGVLRDLDLIREVWHKRKDSGIYVNRLELGLDSRGLRPPNDKDGSFYSSHKQGTAMDLEPVSGRKDVPELWNMVHDMCVNGEFESINTLESLEFTPGWVHVAKMNHDQRPFVVKP